MLPLVVAIGLEADVSACCIFFNMYTDHLLEVEGGDFVKIFGSSSDFLNIMLCTKWYCYYGLEKRLLGWSKVDLVYFGV